MSKVGLIARCDRSGLGLQTRRLYRLLKPSKVMLIDSTYFNANKQFPKWYDSPMIIKGFPNDREIEEFLDGLDTVISCETFYNNRFTSIAKQRKVKTILIANPEFMDWYKKDWWMIPKPNKVVVPSEWKLEEMRKLFNAEYIPTPICDDEFAETRKVNLKRTGDRNYLFMNGKTAAHDRNGLESLYRALELSKGDYTVTVKAQDTIKKHPDPRLRYDFSNTEDQGELYKGFDVLILPRRYGGQALSMNEALISALPVVMTDIDPNNRILPKEWLVAAKRTGQFMARTMIDIYSADPIKLAEKLNTLDTGLESKQHAYYIGKQYEAENLREKYEELLS